MNDRQNIIDALATVVDQVVADQCCSSCSTAVVDDENTYAYFHAQDIERAFALPGSTVPVADDASVDWGMMTSEDEAEDLIGADEAIDDAEDLVADLYIGYGRPEMKNDIQFERALTQQRLAIVAALESVPGIAVVDPHTNADRIIVRPA